MNIVLSEQYPHGEYHEHYLEYNVILIFNAGALAHVQYVGIDLHTLIFFYFSWK